MAGPNTIDTINVDIQANLQGLRSSMAQAEQIVDGGARNMAAKTERHGGFLGGLGLGTAGKGFAHLLAGVHLVRGAVEGLRAAANASGDGWDRAIEGAGGFADALTFGLHGAIVDAITGFTGINQKLDETSKHLQEQGRALNAIRARQAAEGDLAIAETSDPYARAMAQRRRAQLDIDAAARAMQGGGARRDDIARFVGARERAADIEEVRSVFGRDVPADMVQQLLQYLQQISQNTSQGPR